MDFKEYFKQITGLRIFIYLTNKTLVKSEKNFIKDEVSVLTEEEFKKFIHHKKCLSLMQDLVKLIEIAVEELLKLNHGVLELEDLLGQKLFNEIYTEEKFNENKVKMTIENAEECNECNEWFGISELKRNYVIHVTQRWCNNEFTKN